MDYLVNATPTGRLRDLSADDRDALMAERRERRGPGCSSQDAAGLPYNDVEVTALAAHPAFPETSARHSELIVEHQFGLRRAGFVPDDQLRQACLALQHQSGRICPQQVLQRQT